MPNIIDYLKSRGEISFKQTDIEEVDKIIFARFSYLPFKEINLDKKETIESIANKMNHLATEKFIWKDDKELIKELGKTKRYKDLIVSDYKEILDIEAQKQFAAVTIWLPKRYKYISFRGTDMSLVGWKEDFNMTFMKDIPSQLEAVTYLNDIGRKYRSKLILGGHSKGGNLAIYSAIFCKDRIKKKIVNIINADGPGFDKSVISSDNYKKILDKIDTYIPQSSVVGRLLEHEDEYEIIQSTQKGIMQHDIFSWQVNESKLVRIQSLTKDSQIINATLKNWLKSTTIEQRERFVNVIYEIILAAEAEYISDFKIDIPKRIKNIINTYKAISTEERKEIEKVMKILFESVINTLKENRKFNA